MFNSQRSKNRTQCRIALIAPLLLAFVFTFSTKTIAQHKKVKKEFTQKNVEIIELLISKESSEEDLKNITSDQIIKIVSLTIIATLLTYFLINGGLTYFNN